MDSKKNIKLPCLSLLLLGTALLCSFFASAQRPGKATVQVKQPTRILFLFDASQSMFGQWESDTKYEIAKKLLTNLCDSLDKLKDVETALHVYGHTKKFPPQDCDDNRLEVPFAKANGRRIREKLNSISPSGTTPIARSLEACGNDFPEGQSRNIIILITDGIEECNGDPCAVSAALQKKGIFLKPFIIGLNLSADLQKQFECVGTFYDAATEKTFSTIMNVVISQALNNTTLQVNLLDVKGNPTETNVNMTFYDSYSGAVRYNFIHTMNSRGLPDTLVVDPLSTYKIVVQTLPPVEKDSVVSLAGKHTIVGIDVPQGDLFLKFEGLTDYRDLQCIVRTHNELQTLYVQKFNTTQKFLVGKYDLEVLTLPRLYIGDVDISQSKTTTVQIPNPGIVTLVANSPGYGSVYVMDKNTMKWIKDMNPDLSRESVTLLPGRYRVVYRAKNARESDYTVDREFSVTSGSSQTVNLF